jgi:hypothetical protein
MLGNYLLTWYQEQNKKINLVETKKKKKKGNDLKYSLIQKNEKMLTKMHIEL